MRVLWFTNIPMPAMDEHVGVLTRGSGHWMSELLRALRRFVPEMSLGVATTWDGAQDKHFVAEGIEYYLLGGCASKVLRRLQARSGSVPLAKCVEVVRSFKPDLIHIHGTERPWGLLAVEGLVQAPVLVTIQGLMKTVVANYFGSTSPWQLLRTLTAKDLLLLRTPFSGRRNAERRAQTEARILESVGAYTGQTEWDRAHVLAANPKASYFRVGRVLRKPFYENQWRLDACQRHTVIFTNARDPLRGVETIMTAVGLLRREFPDIRLRIVGMLSKTSGYGAAVARRASSLGSCVELVGWIPPEEMVRELASSHVFAIASHVENESNSLCEAMLMGMPCVASFAGGMPTMMTHGQTGLFFPIGEAAVLAHRLRTIFQDDSLAQRLGAAARAEAAQRHDPKRVVDELMQAYRAAAGARSD
jgi:glycosyltransferase involved in cell wall biosynthesis